MAWVPDNIQYTTNGLSGSSIKVVNPVGRDNGDFCGLLIKSSSGGNIITQQLSIQEAAICRPCLRQIQQKCPNKPLNTAKVSRKVNIQRNKLNKAIANNINLA